MTKIRQQCAEQGARLVECIGVNGTCLVHRSPCGELKLYLPQGGSGDAFHCPAIAKYKPLTVVLIRRHL